MRRPRNVHFAGVLKFLMANAERVMKMADQIITNSAVSGDALIAFERLARMNGNPSSDTTARIAIATLRPIFPLYLRVTKMPATAAIAIQMMGSMRWALAPFQSRNSDQISGCFRTQEIARVNSLTVNKAKVAVLSSQRNISDIHCLIGSTQASGQT